MSYLEEAAQQLRTIAADTDKAATQTSYPARYADERHRIADGFAALAAIEQGLIPAAMVADIVARATKEATS